MNNLSHIQEIDTKLYNYFSYNNETNKVCFYSSKWEDFEERFFYSKEGLDTLNETDFPWYDYTELPLEEFNVIRIKLLQYLIKAFDHYPNLIIMDITNYLKELQELNRKIDSTWGVLLSEDFEKLLECEHGYLDDDFEVVEGDKILNKEEMVQFLDDFIAKTRENEKKLLFAKINTEK